MDDITLVMTLNLPYSDQLAREVLSGFQRGGIFRNKFDAKTIPLEDILEPLDATSGFRIYSITEGPGKHKAEWSLGRHMTTGKAIIESKEYDVPHNQVYATINSRATLSGECSTYVFKRGWWQGNLHMIARYVHLRS